MSIDKIEFAEVISIVGPANAEGKHECPACGGHNLAVAKKAGNAVVKCWTPGCAKGAAWKAIRGKLIPKEQATTDKKNWPGLTLAEFGKQKSLSVSALHLHFGIYEATYERKPAVAFPYGMEVDGKWVRTGTKLRFGSSHETFWLKGGEHGEFRAAPFGLCRPELADCSDIVLVEGESDVLTLAAHEIAALGISGANGWKPEFAQLDAIRNAERIFIIQEPGKGGEDFVRRVSQDVPAEKVYIVSLPVKDPSELHLKYVDSPRREPPFVFSDIPIEIVQGRRKLIESGEWIPRNDDPFLVEFDAAIAKARPLGGEYALQSFASIEPRKIEWFWPNRIPQGKITVFAGNPDVGKSIVSCDLAAIASTGRAFPDTENTCGPMDVLMLFCEDDAADTVRPRLDAAGADVQRIHVLKVVVAKNASAEDRQLAFDTDLKLLEKALADNPKIKLVIVDPITSFLGDIRTEKEKDVREVLVPLAAVAARTGVTFVLIAHFNKRSDVTALHKIMGAVAMSGVARAAWLFAADSEDEEQKRHLMLRGKLNIARKVEGLTYTIAEKDLPTGGAPVIVWGEATTVTAEKAFGSFGAFGDKQNSKVAEAGKWLTDFLGESAKAANDIFEAGRACGISERSVLRAKKELGIQSEKVQNRWFWRFPRATVAD